MTNAVLQYGRHLLVLLLALRAYKSKSLTPLGIAASIATGLVHTLHPWLVMFVLLAGFYLPSSRFTKLKAEIKAKLTVSAGKDGKTEGEGGEGARTHVQVLANSMVASVLILAHWYTLSTSSGEGSCWSDNVLVMGVVAQYAAVTADTWSSELGILSQQQPILITTLKPCPKGTNGGVSPLGLGVALAAGAYIGTLAMVFTPLCPDHWTLASRAGFIVLMSGLGLFGSLLDSLLGAVFQKSVVNDKGLIIEAEGGGPLQGGGAAGKSKVVSGKLDLLTNNQVNLLMAVLTSAVGMGVWALIV